MWAVPLGRPKGENPAGALSLPSGSQGSNAEPSADRRRGGRTCGAKLGRCRVSLPCASPQEKMVTYCTDGGISVQTKMYGYKAYICGPQRHRKTLNCASSRRLIMGCSCKARLSLSFPWCRATGRRCPRHTYSSVGPGKRPCPKPCGGFTPQAQAGSGAQAALLAEWWWPWSARDAIPGHKPCDARQVITLVKRQSGPPNFTKLRRWTAAQKDAGYAVGCGSLRRSDLPRFPPPLHR